MRQLTREEHVTRAMLLGRIYDPNSHSYYQADDKEWFNEIDADTLEVIDYDEINKRYSGVMGKVR